MTAQDGEPAPLTSMDPEPPIGTMVRDVNGRLWRRGDLGPSHYWFPIEDDGSDINDDPESWTKVAGNYGPVTVHHFGGGRD